MNKNIPRRAFITTTLTGVGGMALASRISPFSDVPEENTGNAWNKNLMATTDYIDNIIINNKGTRYGIPVTRSEEYYLNYGCYFNREQLDDLHKYLASIGVTRHQWIYETIWNLYEDYPHNFDLLEEARKSAHKYGIEFYAIIKPFEGGGFGKMLPSTMPVPDTNIAVKDLCGIHPTVRPFVAANLDKNLKRKPGTSASGKTIYAIRLVKGDNRETRIKKEHLSIFTSATNNNFQLYKGTFTYRESFEKRYRFPYWRECRILNLEDLQIPQGHNYMLIKCSLADAQGTFSNEKGNIVELVGSEGEVLPCTLSTGPVTLEEHKNKYFDSKVYRQVDRYLQSPEVLTEINNPERMKFHYNDYYAFGNYHLGEYTTLDKEGYLACVQGKPEYLLGNLNPVYPEVRKHWLEMIQFCLDRGVDGINIRVANHSNLPEYWEYGYNEPAEEACNGEVNRFSLSRVNGNSYTSFLREARKLIKAKGKNITIHLLSELLEPDNRPLKIPALPPNFEWQWETWVNEIADKLEFRGVVTQRPWNLDRIIDAFAHATKKANKPLFFQGDFYGLSFERPIYSTEEEIKYVDKHLGLNGYVLYETANFTRINNEGKIEGKPELTDLITNQSWK